MLQNIKLSSLADKIIAKAKEDQKIENEEKKEKKEKKERGISRASIKNIKGKK